MKHALSSFALSLGLVLPVLAACSGNTTEDPVPADDRESTGTVDADVKAGRKKSCAAVGGACVGLSPSSCSGGHFADATKVSCGGGIGVACCVTCPVLSPPAPGFCPDGKVVPRTNENGCAAGFDCVTPPNACVSAGGTCVGLSPSSCPAGHIGDATTYSCGSGIGVACCLP